LFLASTSHHTLHKQKSPLSASKLKQNILIKMTIKDAQRGVNWFDTVSKLQQAEDHENKRWKNP